MGCRENRTVFFEIRPGAKAVSTNISMVIMKGMLSTTDFQKVLDKIVNVKGQSKQLLDLLKKNGVVDQTVDGIKVDISASGSYINRVILYSTVYLNRVIALFKAHFDEIWSKDDILKMLRTEVGQDDAKRLSMVYVLFGNYGLEMDDEVQRRFGVIFEDLNQTIMQELLY